MALVNPYCTVQQVRDELRNKEDELIPQIEEAINQASRWIDDFKGRDYFHHDFSVEPLTIDRFDDAIMDWSLLMPFLPIIEITKVTVNGTEWTEGVEYRIKSDRIVSLTDRFDCFLGGRCGKAEILGSFGYEQDSDSDVPTGMPPYINRAAILVAAAFSGQNQKEIVGLDGSKTEVIEKSIPKVVWDILGKRKIVI